MKYSEKEASEYRSLTYFTPKMDAPLGTVCISIIYTPLYASNNRLSLLSEPARGKSTNTVF
jgi:hypothetical protein